MANELMGRLNPPAAQRVAGFALGAIIDTRAVVLQVADESVDCGHRGQGGGAQAVQSPDQSTSPANSRASVVSTHSNARSGCAPYWSSATVWRCSAH